MNKGNHTIANQPNKGQRWVREVLSLLLSSRWISKEHILIVKLVSQNHSKLTCKKQIQKSTTTNQPKGTKFICSKTCYLDISNNNSITVKRKWNQNNVHGTPNSLSTVQIFNSIPLVLGSYLIEYMKGTKALFFFTFTHESKFLCRRKYKACPKKNIVGKRYHNNSWKGKGMVV